MPDSHDAGTPAPLSALRSFLVDLDGVVYTGNTAIPGAAEFFAFLRETGRRFQCITNNSTLTAAQYVMKLTGMGISVSGDQVLTSPQATALYLRERYPEGARLYPIGEEGLVSALLEAGFQLVYRSPDAVVCGLDRRLTYERLKGACLAIQAGAQFIATNPDLALPTEEGLLPGNGASIAYIRAATGVAPLVIGKPEAAMLDVARERMSASREETAIVGDGLLTDMMAGHHAGVTKILVLTGVATRADLDSSSVVPDYVFENLTALQRALG